MNLNSNVSASNQTATPAPFSTRLFCRLGYVVLFWATES